MVVLETGLQDPDEGPVLDPDQPSLWKAEVRPTWWSQGPTRRSPADLISVGFRSFPSGTAASRKTPASPTSSSALTPTCWMFGASQHLLAARAATVVASSPMHVLAHRSFCGSRSIWSLCGHQGESEVSARVVETGRRKVAVSGRLENQGENAYGTTVHISTSSNLLFSSLTVKVRNHPESSGPTPTLCNSTGSSHFPTGAIGCSDGVFFGEQPGQSAELQHQRSLHEDVVAGRSTRVTGRVDEEPTGGAGKALT